MADPSSATAVKAPAMLKARAPWPGVDSPPATTSPAQKRRERRRTKRVAGNVFISHLRSLRRYSYSVPRPWCAYRASCLRERKALRPEQKLASLDHLRIELGKIG